MIRKLFILGLTNIAISISARVVNIPDANFKAYLVGNYSINTNHDSEIQVSEAVAFTGSINCMSKNITNLTGIESFVNLGGLFCGLNPISNLNVTSNILLKTLRCQNNPLTTLDVTKNTLLEDLTLTNNNLTSINVSQNINLL
jgi:hypothetical protein